MKLIGFSLILERERFISNLLLLITLGSFRKRGFADLSGRFIWLSPLCRTFASGKQWLS